ncbi:hypothetical protein [Promicromonospora soli]|uniref:Uncharacterized protein n=1 Tax=Promicromonospora soli TaxID=2035533 RepID=A0A919G7H1_9MICO|nr:hypothetical protein [Promicromonospora soli]GHH79445.1 hypothetical protein GCM10017772_45220 [Promicromonospora soli]
MSHPQDRGALLPSTGPTPGAPFPTAPPPSGSSPAGRLQPPRHAAKASRGTTRTDANLARQTAAMAGLAAGVVHCAATPSHWEEWILAGVFFTAATAFQVVWGVLQFLFESAVLRVAGLVANLGLLAVWAVSRVGGMPFGPGAGVPEPAGPADLIVGALEAVAVVGLLWSLLPRERHGVLTPVGYRTVVGLALLTFGATAVPGVSAALEHSHAHGTGEGGGHDHHDMHEPTDPATTGGSEAPAEDGKKTQQPEPSGDGHSHAPGEEHD